MLVRRTYARTTLECTAVLLRLYTFWVDEFVFQRWAGFCTDFLLISPGLVPPLRHSIVDFERRGREKPSDTCAVWIELG
jgi:hypothetical protein